MTDYHAVLHAVLHDAQGRATYFRNAVHAWGAAHPFSLATVAAVIAFVAGAIVL